MGLEEPQASLQQELAGGAAWEVEAALVRGGPFPWRRHFTCPACRACTHVKTTSTGCAPCHEAVEA